MSAPHPTARRPVGLHNVWWTLPRLGIRDKDNLLRPLGPLYPEQRIVVQSLLEHDRTLVLKARQRGITTIVALFFVWYMLNRRGGGSVAQVTHEERSMKVLNGKMRIAWESIPDALRPPLVRDVAEEFSFGDASFHQMVAGGRGQGRSTSFQHSHWTEIAHYPKGSSAVGGSGVDREVWASVHSTIQHRPGITREVVESSGKPGGLFQEMCREGRKNKEINMIFIPWFHSAEYTLAIPRDWEMKQDEADLFAEYHKDGLTTEHLVWRRMKLRGERYSLRLFRQEYPSNEDEPFLATGTQYFDQEMLLKMQACALRATAKDDLVIYLPFEPGRKYGISHDASGGVGEDDAVSTVLRDDGRQAARWRSNTTKPHGQAHALARLSAFYGRAPVLVEKNNHGVSVIAKCEELGVNLWTDENGNYWWTQRGANNTKQLLVDFVAELIASGQFLPLGPDEPWLADPIAISELIDMSENKKGNVVAPEGKHDDSAMSFMLACWCIKDHLIRRRNVKLWTPETAREQKAARLREFDAMARERR